MNYIRELFLYDNFSQFFLNFQFLKFSSFNFHLFFEPFKDRNRKVNRKI